MESQVNSPIYLNSINKFFIIPVIIIGGVLLYYMPISEKLYAYQIGYFLDSLHFVGGVALGLIVAYLYQASSKVWDIIKTLLTLLAITSFLEVMQLLTSRNASFPDWLHGTVGALLGASVFFAYHKNKRALFLLIAAMTLGGALIQSVIPSIRVALAIHYFDQSFPKIDSFESHYSKVGWQSIIDGCAINLQRSQKWQSDGDYSLLVDNKITPCKGIKFVPTQQNWSEFSRLTLHTFSQSSDCIKMRVRIFSYLPSESIYTNQRFCIKPGQQTLTVALQETANFSLSSITRLDIIFDTDSTFDHLMIDEIALQQP